MIRTVVAMLALFGSTAAWATDPDVDERPANEARVTLAKYADCVVGRRPEQAAAVVMGLIGVEVLTSKYTMLIDSGCLIKSTKLSDPMLAMPGDNLHYALAEALIRRTMRTYTERDLKAVPPLPQGEVDVKRYTPIPGKRYKPDSLKQMAGMLRFDQQIIFTRQFGDCVVRVDPKGSHELLMTSAANQAERAAIQLLVPAFSRCIPPGQQFKANVATMRGTVALNYYRLVRMAEGAPFAILTPKTVKH